MGRREALNAGNIRPMSEPREIKSYRARWIVPMDRPPIDDGVLTVRDGVILALQPGDTARDLAAEDLGDVVLMPGFINAHTHLELGFCRGRIPPCPLWDWFDRLIELNRRPDAGPLRRQSIIEGARESLEAGVTCIADISRSGENAALLSDSPIRKTCYIELISGAKSPPYDAHSLEHALAQVRTRAQDDRLRIGISPHAPYSVTPEDLAAAASLAARDGCPLTVHVLETQDERDWFAQGSARLDAYLAKYGVGGGARRPGGSALKLLRTTGILRHRPLLAHLNYVTDDDLAILKKSRAAIVWCPRTHAYFGHAPHRWLDMLNAGIPVCFGTDSLASAPSLSALDELRFLHAAHPGVDSMTLLECAITRGAEALGLGQRLGTLTPGKWADFVTIPLPEVLVRDVGRAVLETQHGVSGVWVNGANVFTRR